MTRLHTICRLALAAVLGAMLAGCVDAKVEVTLTGASTARATMTQIMGADFYAMIKMNAEEAESRGRNLEDPFCHEGALTENRDGTATCVLAQEGQFAELTLGTPEETLVFTPAGRGLVRVSLPLAVLKRQIGADEAMDEETQKMVEAFFAGRGITVWFRGLAVTDTNMTLAADGRSAQHKIMFLDLLRDKPGLPQELYAVVRVPR